MNCAARIDELSRWSISITRASGFSPDTRRGCWTGTSWDGRYTSAQRLLVLDQPTAGVDPVGSRGIRDLILEFKARGLRWCCRRTSLNRSRKSGTGCGSHLGQMVREGRLDDILAIENQTEIVLENATPELIEEVQRVIAGKASVVSRSGRPRTTLEKLFLEATGGGVRGTGKEPT